MDLLNTTGAGTNQENLKHRKTHDSYDSFYIIMGLLNATGVGTNQEKHTKVTILSL